jgi:hypothetical protein
LATDLSAFSLLAAVIAGIISIIVVSAIFTSDPAKRKELFGAAAFGAVVFLIILFFGSLITRSPLQNQLSVDELLLLSNTQAERTNYDRAVHFLEQAKSNLPADDPREKAIKTRIADLKAKQVGNK